MNKRGVRLLSILLSFAAGTTFADLQTIPLPATLDQQRVGELNARLNDRQIVSVEISPLRAKLKDILSADRYAKLPDTNPAWVSPDQLAAAGVSLRFDFQNLTLHLSIPPDQKRTQSLNLIGMPELTANRTVKPGDFSAYMNVRGGVDYIEASRNTATGFSDPQVALENAFNLRGLVLENETAINPAANKTWEKRDTRLIWDLPASRRRWTLGDLNFPVTSFQGFLPMAGLSLHRENRLQPYRITSPLGQSSFFLKEDSKVEIMVNGHTVQSLQLNAGPHQISNFPLTGGANNVILRITDPVGRVEYVNATYFYDPGLLRRGESEFNYAVGFPSRPDADNPVYQYRSELAASAYHRWGITDTLTAGLNAQAVPDAQQAGAEIVISTVAGLLDFDVALTHNRGIGSGHAERLQYHYYAPQGSAFTDSVLSLAVGHASDAFVTPNPFARALRRNETVDFQARYSQRLGEQWNCGVGFSQQWERSPTNRTTSRIYSLTVSHHWGKVNTDVTLQRKEDSSGRDSWSGFFSVIINFGHGTTAYSSHDSAAHSTRSEVQYSAPNNVQAFYGALGAEHSRGQANLYGNARYFGRHAELALNHDTQTSGENRTSLRWGTAIVYTDGQFGISRPVRDSFAMFASTGSLRDEGGLGVQPQGGQYAAREDWLGPAVMPELTAYYNTRVTVEPWRPEADFDPQAGDILVRPTYRSGTLVRIGRPSSANVTATLTWADGKPAALQSGTLQAANGTATEFFSNREGLMYLHGLPMGSYQGTLTDRPEARFTITIPTDKNVSVDLGTIRLSSTE